MRTILQDMKSACLCTCMVWGWALFLLSSCYKPVDVEDPQEQDKCELTVGVCADDEEGLYPTLLCVYDETGKNVFSGRMTDDNPELHLSLPWGKYRMVALSGTDYYVLPRQYTLDAVIEQSEAQLPLIPLYMGQANLSLSSNTAKATLLLARQSASLLPILYNVPDEVESMQFTLSTLFTAVSMQGEWLSPAAVTFPMVKEGDVWTTPQSVYMFPSKSQNTVVSVQADCNGQVMYYTFNVSNNLHAGLDYGLEVRLDEAQEAYTLEVNSEGLEDKTPDTLLVDALPTHYPALWHNMILAHIALTGEDEADLLLLSSNEWEEVYSAYSAAPDDALCISSQYVESSEALGYMLRWTVPTKAEAQLLHSLYAGQHLYALNEVLSAQGMPVVADVNDNGKVIRYLCSNGQQTFTFAADNSSVSKAGSKTTYRLRLVRRLHVKRQSN